MIESDTVYNVTVDCVIYAYDFEKLNIIVLERQLKYPNTDKYIIDDIKLPGNFLYAQEDFDEGAARIVRDLTGLGNIDLHQFKAFGSPNRTTGERDQIWFKHLDYPVNRVYTVAYYSLLKPTQMELPLNSIEHAKWIPVYEINEMAYDHEQIVKESIEALRMKIRLQSNVVFQLLPVKFTMRQLLRLYEEIYQVTLDRRNFSKKINSLDYIVQLNEKQQDVTHKPGWLYMFSNDLYEQSMKEMNIV